MENLDSEINRPNQYKTILKWFKGLPNTERWGYFIELYIDIKFMENDEFELCDKNEGILEKFGIIADQQGDFNIEI